MKASNPLLQHSSTPMHYYSTTPIFYLLCLFALLTLSNGGLVEAADVSPRYIQYSFTLQNTKNTVLPTAEFWTYAPVKKTSTQKCTNIKADYPYEIISDDLGNQVLHFNFSDVAPFGTKIINIRAELNVFLEPRQMGKEEVKTFIEPEKYIECTAKEIIDQAKKLKDSDRLKTAKNIYSWVARALTYTGYVKNERGALWAFKQKKGDCTEYAYLFVALCRAAGIPARAMGGYVVNRNSVLKPGDYHNWAEFYVDGIWRVADPQKKIFMKDESHYITMRIIGRKSESSMDDFHRFRFSGEGLKVSMNK